MCKKLRVHQPLILSNSFAPFAAKNLHPLFRVLRVFRGLIQARQFAGIRGAIPTQCNRPIRRLVKDTALRCAQDNDILRVEWFVKGLLIAIGKRDSFGKFFAAHQHTTINKRHFKRVIGFKVFGFKRRPMSAQGESVTNVLS